MRAAVHPDFAYDGVADYPRRAVRHRAACSSTSRCRRCSRRPFAPGPLDADGPLAIVSYARDRPHLPSIEAPCAVVSSFGAVAALDCAVNYGASGAPVLQGEGEDARLVAVVSAKGAGARRPTAT